MKLAASIVLCALTTACSSFRNWRELRTAPMSLGEAWKGFEDIVGSRDGWTEDRSGSDRGNGLWESRWKERESPMNFPIRNRLRMEILVDEGSRADGWLLRYAIEQEKCEDLRRHIDPREQDWSSDGQNTEAEAVLGERLVRRLAPDSVEVTAPERR
jgi:hypothetical protein